MAAGAGAALPRHDSEGAGQGFITREEKRREEKRRGEEAKKDDKKQKESRAKTAKQGLEQGVSESSLDAQRCPAPPPVPPGPGPVLVLARGPHQVPSAGGRDLP